MAIRRYRKGTYNRSFKRRMSRRGKYSRGRRSFQSRVKRVIMKTAETKDFTIGIENVQLYHNMGQTALGLVTHSIQSWFNPWARIAKGTNSFNRIGDVITPRGMAVRMYWANKTDRPNTMLRLIVAVLPKTIGTTVTTESFDPFEQTQNFSDVQNAMCLNADKDRGIKFIYDKVHRLSEQFVVGSFSGGPAKEMTKFIKLWIRRKKARNITFNREAQDIVNKPIAIYAIPYEQYDTSILSNVASIAGQIKMYYKDV